MKLIKAIPKLRSFLLIGSKDGGGVFRGWVERIGDWVHLLS
jgi:hypothetical protein